MTTPNDSDWPQPDKNSTNDELVVDIQHTREQLGQTIEALSQKFDLKAQARRKVHDANARANTQFAAVAARAGHLRARVMDAASNEPVNAAAVGAAVGIGIIAVMMAFGRWRRQR